MKFSTFCNLAFSFISTVAAEATVDDRFPGHVLSTETTDPGSLGIDTVKQLAGYLNIEDQDKHFFYWFFESRNDPTNDPVVLWINGGPGCSSLMATLGENGPATIAENLTVIHNPYSWNNNASLLYLDQPVNTGFSYSNKDVTSSVMAAKDVYAFLELFFKANPQFSKLPFHVAGESYAGHFVPAIGSEILTHPDRSFNFASIAIGNGLTDPLTQYNWYEPMACGQGGEPPHVNETSCEKMKYYQDICIPNIQTCYDDQSNYTECTNTTFHCNAVLGVFERQGLNLYDVRGGCTTHSGSCYIEFDWVTKYMNQPFVQQALGVNHTWRSCGGTNVYSDIINTGDWMKPYQENVTTILEKGIPVLVYNGDKDFICNWLGGHAWTDKLPWYGHNSFSQTPLTEWVVNGNASGQVKNYNNLTFLRVYESGHFVPHDQPVNALAMINSWISGNLGFK